MGRREAPPGVPARTVATVALAMFQGLAPAPDRVSGELLVQGLRWLFAGLHATASEPPPE